MLGADKVCRSWRHAAREEPELWRRVDMRRYGELASWGLADLDRMAADAVWFSQGQCEAFTGAGSGVHDDFLRFLANQAPLLKSLILVLCRDISADGFMEVVRSFPLLEELELSECCDICENGVRVFEVVAKACPRLQHLKYSRLAVDHSRDGEAMVIAS
ncbi:unnamed protein product [Urochloa humidicola]